MQISRIRRSRKAFDRTIISFDGIRSGELSAGTQTEQGGYKFSIDYLNDSVVLTVIPEPGTLGIALFGGLALLLRRRRQSLFL